jgi:ABC-type protease/lipase transport system fused ATPase/permease subunit
VVITQRPTVLNCMDKLLILRAGRVEAFGPPSEVLMRIVKPARAAPASSTTNGTAQAATDSAPAPDRKQA